MRGAELLTLNDLLVGVMFASQVGYLHLAV